MYPLQTTLTLDGPGGFGGMTWLYVSESVRGAESVSVDEGLDAAHEVIEEANEADSLMELNSALRR
jgi:hypothetical protein